MCMHSTLSTTVYKNCCTKSMSDAIKSEIMRGQQPNAALVANKPQQALQQDRKPGVAYYIIQMNTTLEVMRDG